MKMSTYSFKGKKRLWTPRDEDENHVISSTQQQHSISNDLPESKAIKKEPETSKWNINMIIRLLRLYGVHESLWNSKHEDFRNRKLRKAALIDIAAAMKSKVTTTQVVQKINVLRATYRYEKRRIKQRMRKGVGATTKLKWFALADSFLKHVPRIGIGHKRKRCENSESESDLEHAMVLTIDPEAVIPYDTEQINTPVTNNSIECFIKAEELSKDVENIMPKKFKWSGQHSLRFVQLLATQPVLWSENVTFTDEDKAKALESIALQLDIPIQVAESKLQIFSETYLAEGLKINENPNYKPSFIWWQLAENFMPGKAHIIDFVDANAVIPATPLPITEYPQSPLMPINPIPSVSIDVAYDYSNDEASRDKSDISDHTSKQAKHDHMINPEDDLLDGKWSLKHSVKFLRLYGSHRCLWDLNSPEYRCRELRAAAIEDMTAAMGHGLNSDYVAKKIKIFRITYMQHRKRMLAAIKAGQEPEIQLRWFPLADSFLRPHIGLRSIKEQDLEIPQFNYQYVMANLNLIDPELLNDFRYC